jgi:hypothetical protein
MEVLVGANEGTSVLSFFILLNSLLFLGKPSAKHNLDSISLIKLIM